LQRLDERYQQLSGCARLEDCRQASLDATPGFSVLVKWICL
jgi:hypothetical protein